MSVLRDYQSVALGDIRAAFRSGAKAVCLVSPTGSGKTVLLAHMAFGAQQKGNRMTVLVHRQELVRQTSKALAEMGVHHGLIASGEQPDYARPVQLAMAATLAGRMDAPPPEFLVLDEGHHALADTYIGLIARYPNAKILLLTATPQRLDGRGLGTVCQKLVLGPSVQSLIARGFLCKPIYYAPPTDIDLSDVRKVAGDFNRGQIDELMDRPHITGSAVDHYARISPGAAAVAFCTSIKHAEHVRDQFSANGWPSASIDGTLSDEDREDRVNALAEGRICVLTSVDVISEGFDLPCIETAILLRPTESLGLHLQQIGRSLRPMPGKKNAIILDHVGNCLRHGLAEEERAWSLKGGVKKAAPKPGAEPALTTCPKCFTLHQPAPACEKCGHEYPIKERKTEEVAGDLAILTPEQVAAERARIKERQAVGMAKDRTALEVIAKQRGYKSGWVEMMLRVRAKKKFSKKPKLA